ncbi:MAG: MmcQ/YjbR family DNA-binding protein [Muribaculaceae bacterium]|nr:MmcQ/YjbR family DNA-binding protein [Muribaculaceae bacterium]
MNVERFRDYCLSMPEARENMPWTDPKYQNLMTFTVGDKWFCLLDLENKFCDLKCPVDQVLELQERYNGIDPAWHMNKTHWIKVLLDSDVSDKEMKALVRQAYDCIVASLPKSKKEKLGLC